MLRLLTQPVRAVDAPRTGHDRDVRSISGRPGVASPRVSIMADVAFTCPQCGHTYQFATYLAGKRGRCKTCQAVFRIPAPAPAAPTMLAPATVKASRESPSVPPLSQSGRSDDDGKIAFRCPSCGHGYRLDAKLAGKHGRCTTCRGTFAI